jgi:hypothetical protein
MKHVFFLSLLATMTVALNSCFTAKPAVVSKQTFTYDYKTAKTEPPGSANLLVTLIKPYYANDFVRTFGGSDVFVNFRKFIGDDIEELLVDKGYHIKSTYPSFDNMTYDEKKESDVALQIEIVPTFTAAEGGWWQYSHFSMNGPTYTFGYKGSVSLIGKINLIAIEPLSHEKIWIKSVDIPSIQNIQINTAHNLPAARVDINFLNDPNVYNALGAALQQQYHGIMEQIDTYLDPREFLDLKGQIKELKNKKVY